MPACCSTRTDRTRSLSGAQIETYPSTLNGSAISEWITDRKSNVAQQSSMGPSTNDNSMSSSAFCSLADRSGISNFAASLPTESSSSSNSQEVNKPVDAHLQARRQFEGEGYAAFLSYLRKAASECYWKTLVGGVRHALVQMRSVLGVVAWYKM